MYTKRFAFLGAIAMVAMVGCESATGPQSETVGVTSEALSVATNSPVNEIIGPPGSPLGPIVEGASSTVRRNKNGATATLKTSGLTAGNAYTVWAVVFDSAGPPSAVVYLAGHVVGGNGQATFSGHLSSPDIDNPLGAEIHLVVRDHGEAIPGQIPSLIHTGGGGCPCTDVQVSIQVAP